MVKTFSTHTNFSIYESSLIKLLGKLSFIHTNSCTFSYNYASVF